MKILDFSDQEAENQLQDLNEILTMAIWARFAEGKDTKSLGEAPKPEEIELFIKNNYTQEEAQNIFTKESGKIIGEYLKEITKDAPQDKIDQIKTILSVE